ncbi:MAG: hypothetical protein BWX92_02318 [Deltaproteobacteria bacterium ADurb.Bin135]|nr:MAG: hypothetical protein BWX92_02318 [Deltaproteobacteria bacterium ADurb.Bin135]
MGDEILEFAEAAGATDLKQLFDYSEFHGLFKRRNYFLLDKNTFLIIGISRSKIRPFFGLRKGIFELFNKLTEKTGTYYYIALASNKSGWVLPKTQIINQISKGLISYSAGQNSYKINDYNLKDQYGFTSMEGFRQRIGVAT